MFDTIYYCHSSHWNFQNKVRFSWILRHFCIAAFGIIYFQVNYSVIRVRIKCFHTFVLLVLGKDQRGYCYWNFLSFQSLICNYNFYIKLIHEQKLATYFHCYPNPRIMHFKRNGTIVPMQHYHLADIWNTIHALFCIFHGIVPW